MLFSPTKRVSGFNGTSPGSRKHLKFRMVIASKSNLRPVLCTHSVGPWRPTARPLRPANPISSLVLAATREVPAGRSGRT